MFDVLYIYWYTLAAELVIQYILDILLYFLITVDTLIVHAYAFLVKIMYNLCLFRFVGGSSFIYSVNCIIQVTGCAMLYYMVIGY